MCGKLAPPSLLRTLLGKYVKTSLFPQLFDISNLKGGCNSTHCKYVVGEKTSSFSFFPLSRLIQQTRDRGKRKKRKKNLSSSSSSSPSSLWQRRGLKSILLFPSLSFSHKQVSQGGRNKATAESGGSENVGLFPPGCFAYMSNAQSCSSPIILSVFRRTHVWCILLSFSSGGV